MPDAFLIDGYNLIHALGLLDRSLKTKALEHSRRRLLEWLVQSFATDAPRVTIVFDAQHAPPGVTHLQTYQGLRIHFAPSKQSADDMIETLIEEHAAPRTLAVISNDTRLQSAAQHRHALAWSHTDLLDYLDRRAAEARTKSAAQESKGAEPMSPAEREHWMKEFGALELDPEFKEFFDLDRFED